MDELFEIRNSVLALTWISIWKFINKRVSFSDPFNNILVNKNLTDNTYIYTNQITNSIYNVKFRNYKYKLEALDVDNLPVFNNIDEQTNICSCKGVIFELKNKFTLNNTIILSNENDYYVEDIEGNCGEEMIITQFYSTEFIGYNQVYFLLDI